VVQAFNMELRTDPRVDMVCMVTLREIYAIQRIPLFDHKYILYTLHLVLSVNYYSFTMLLHVVAPIYILLSFDSYRSVLFNRTPNVLSKDYSDA